MQNVITKEITQFTNFKLIQSGDRPTIENVTDKISNQLYYLKRTEDKYLALNTMENLVKTAKKAHEKICSKDPNDCGTSDNLSIILYAIEQEKGELNIDTDFGDAFSAEERREANDKINEIIGVVNAQGGKLEELVRELEELKSLHNIGKKNWTRLLRQKTAEYGIEKVVDHFLTADNLVKLASNTHKVIEGAKLLLELGT
jgi:hypothetical protein